MGPPRGATCGADMLDVDGRLAVLQFPNGSANLTYLLDVRRAAASCCGVHRSGSSRPAPTT